VGEGVQLAGKLNFFRVTFCYRERFEASAV
jgi:hypothetical protein